jgi:hypothetical protein
MPQPDSSRNRPWPVDPAAPPPRPPARRAPASGRSPEPLKDGRTPDDKDGNEELERKQDAPPSSRRAMTDRQAAANRARGELESEETGEWAATERFTLEDELEDTWPNVPTRHLDH